MNRFYQKITIYEQEIAKIEPNFDKNLLISITKSLGPTIYKESSEVIKCETKNDILKIQNKFLKFRLGIDKDETELEEAIKQVCKKLSLLTKPYRAIAYYLLVKKFKKEGLYI